jgi:hypothetical protein
MDSRVTFEENNDIAQTPTFDQMPPKGILSWLVKVKVAKSVKEAEVMLLVLAIVAFVVASIIFFSVLSGSKPPHPAGDTRSAANPYAK